MSASVALNDTTQYLTTGVTNLSAATPGGLVTGNFGANDIGGTRSPDILGQVKVDQAWGLAQFMVAAHDNHPAYYGTAVGPATGPTETLGHPADKWGFAVGGALEIKNIPTGPGDVLNVQAVYTDGASRYNFQSLMGQNVAMYGGTGLFGAYQSLAIAGVSDTVFVTNSSQELVQTWGMRGGFTHNWDPYWASAIYGAYAQLRYGSLGSAAICSNMVTMLGFVGTCNPNFNFAVISFNTIWTPVKNLAFTFEVNWTQVDQFSTRFLAPVRLIPVAAGGWRPAQDRAPSARCSGSAQLLSQFI